MVGSDWASCHTVAVVLELIGCARGSSDTGSIGGLESGLTADAESSIEAGNTVGRAGETLLAEVVREVSISTVVHTVSIEQELAGSAGDGWDAG